MIDPFGLLQALAQLAVAFAGFGSIASSLAPRKNSDETKVAAGRLLNMLAASLLTAILAMLPSALALFDMAPRWMWGISAGLGLGLLSFGMPRALLRTYRMMKTTAFNWLSGIFNLFLLAICAVAFVLCMLDIPAGKAAATYVAGLLLLLSVSAILFFRVVYSILRTVSPEGGRPDEPPDA